MVTIISAGESRIKATMAGDGNFEPVSATADLTILGKLPPSDKEALKAFAERALMVVPGAFTEPSVASFNKALAGALSALFADAPEQGRIGASYEALAEAVGGLALKPELAPALAELVGVLLDAAVQDWTQDKETPWASMSPIYKDTWAMVGLYVK
jgi:hypothetical protein